MKKRICIGLSTVCLVLSIVIFSGCSKKEEAKQQDMTTEKAQTVMVDGKQMDKQIVLMDFEEYVPDFQLAIVSKTFGKLSQNSDEKYVKSGKYSAKIQPMGGYSSNSLPSFYYPLQSDLVEFDYTDIRNWECVFMWLYNAQDEPKEVTISLVTEIYSSSNYVTAGSMKCYLKPGWNDVVYFPDTDMLNIVNDVQSIKGICFTFENAGVKKLEDAPVFYLDKVTLNLNAEYEECENILEFDRNEENGIYEIIGFDKSFHAQGYDFYIENQETTPDAEIVEASQEGIEAREGSMVLKLTLHPGDNYMGTWNHLIISEKIVRESGFMNIPEEERSQYRLAFDMYSANRDFFVVPLFYVAGNSREFKPVSSVKLPKEQWVTGSFDFSIFDSDHIGDPGNLRLSWPEYPESWGDLVVYFDNFRYEKIQ